MVMIQVNFRSARGSDGYRSLRRQVMERLEGAVQVFDTDLEKVLATVKMGEEEQSFCCFAIFRNGYRTRVSSSHEDPLGAVELALEKLEDKVSRHNQKLARNKGHLLRRFSETMTTKVAV